MYKEDTWIVSRSYRRIAHDELFMVKKKVAKKKFHAVHQQQSLFINSAILLKQNLGSLKAPCLAAYYGKSG